jgi:hypothetical protein
MFFAKLSNWNCIPPRIGDKKMCLIVISPVPAQLRLLRLSLRRCRGQKMGWRAGERSGTGTTTHTAGRGLAVECSGTGTTLHTARRGLGGEYSGTGTAPHTRLGGACQRLQRYRHDFTHRRLPLPRRRTPMRRGGENSRSVLQAVSTYRRVKFHPKLLRKIHSEIEPVCEVYIELK